MIDLTRVHWYADFPIDLLEMFIVPVNFIRAATLQSGKLYVQGATE